jgi:hypothetical protein
MKKNYLLIVVTCMLVLNANAQNTFSKGDKVLNIGYGLGSYVNYGKTTFPPLSVSLEVGVKDNLFDGKSSLGLGGYISHSASKNDIFYEGLGSYGYTYSFFNLGARAVLHYQLVNKLDTYAGFMLGYSVASSKYYGDYQTPEAAAKVGGIVYSTFLGARYYFNNKFAAYAELGYGISVLEVGLSVKL